MLKQNIEEGYLSTKTTYRVQNVIFITYNIPNISRVGSRFGVLHIVKAVTVNNKTVLPVLMYSITK